MAALTELPKFLFIEDFENVLWFGSNGQGHEKWGRLPFFLNLARSYICTALCSWDDVDVHHYSSPVTTLTAGNMAILSPSKHINKWLFMSTFTSFVFAACNMLYILWQSYLSGWPLLSKFWIITSRTCYVLFQQPTDIQGDVGEEATFRCFDNRTFCWVISIFITYDLI